MPRRRYQGSAAARTPSRPTPLPRRRSRANRNAGWLVVAVGVLVIALNYAMEVSDIVVLPGGHQELYFGGGVLLALAGLWFTGLGDAR